MKQERTRVGIVGGGPAGLMLSHLLNRQGIEHIVIESRSRDEIEHTHRAGILEQGSADLLLDGVSDRILRDGYRHDGIDVRIQGDSYPIDFTGLVGASTYLYPQTDVFIDLAEAAQRAGTDVRFGVGPARVSELTGRPVIGYGTPGGDDEVQIECDLLIGADGSRSTCRHAIPEDQRRAYYREYPFAWFGIMAETGPSHHELIYARSAAGFALVSQRTTALQRLYFQVPVGTEPADWSDEAIWQTFRDRLNHNGFAINEGPITEKVVLPFRSFVSEPMRWGNLLLAGDAAHTVPPTGAKGLNLALQDVRVLAEVLGDWAAGDPGALQAYSTRSLDRVWKAQHFSFWMTSMLHNNPDASDFDRLRTLGELRMLVESEHGRAWLAEAYTGWPNG
ncbi:4-hydroxybenzoate 3-monooxygenase [Enemella evansiae]|uniref:4-hydroxybenzoate 3-monooxygenase n=1 Tax=Enemella evansiae TaxID=2016499 RepID=UPI000B977105|nr:4-hydroxybenzoate 3-monooxygenase [Enemella evansiae]OYN94076.1 4-hydroxybenzoate 3-monooxygenase [Enemella evansiae]OYN95361.1 4-hydroxybenzoate 3-monooxygenase [Enemella evansiae]OYO03465.1 4-hydroxybenzoate 3-monooxygenase [Enemella evansiae]OYO09889.1 4-hydroxybenzoate 3-monooxygenase [Enemella evansiae]